MLVRVVVTLALAQAAAGLPVSWTAPAACPDEPMMADAIQTLVTREPAPGGEKILGEVIATNSGFRLELHVGGSVRILEDPSCDALAEAATLMIAIALDPTTNLSEADQGLLDRFLSEPRPESGEEPAEEEPHQDPTPVSAPPDEEARTPASANRRAIHGAIRIAGGVGWGALPRLDGAVTGAAALLLPRARFELGGGYWFEQEGEVAPGVETKFAAWSLAARGGPVWSIGVVEFPLLLGAEAGQIVGRAKTVANARVARAPWFAVTLSSGVLYVPVRQIALGLLVEGFVAAARPRFWIGGLSAPVHRPRAGGVRGLATVEARFP